MELSAGLTARIWIVRLTRVTLSMTVWVQLGPRFPIREGSGPQLASYFRRPLITDVRHLEPRTRGAFLANTGRPGPGTIDNVPMGASHSRKGELYVKSRHVTDASPTYLCEFRNLSANFFDQTSTMKNGKQARTTTRADRRNDDNDDDVDADKEE